MKIYIASSVSNNTAVELVTMLCHDRGHEVFSFNERSKDVRKNIKRAIEAGSSVELLEMRDRWKEAAFDYSVENARKADLLIYLGPSGCDSWAEVGMAWAAGVPVLGIRSEGDVIDVMGFMVNWVKDFSELDKYLVSGPEKWLLRSVKNYPMEAAAKGGNT